MTPSFCLHFMAHEVEHLLSAHLGDACLYPLSIFLPACPSVTFICKGSFSSRDVNLHHVLPNVLLIC